METRLLQRRRVCRGERRHLWLMHDAPVTAKSAPLCVHSTDALRIYGNFLAKVEAAGHWPPGARSKCLFSLPLPVLQLPVLTRFSDIIGGRGGEHG